MAEITNVNLLYLRKARGIAPLSRYAVQGDGSLVATVPDDMEVRTLHIVRFDARGRSQILETYGVETLRRTEIAATGGTSIGGTDDDIYLFKEGRKTRFLPDRHTTYIDLALAEGGQRFVAAFSDMLASGYTIAFGDIGGRLLWTKDIGFAITRVAIDRGAQHIAVAGETGELLLLDMARNPLARYRQEAPICAVATVGPGRTLFAGGGGVGAIDEAGRLLWFTDLIGEPVELATDAAGRTIAALTRLDDTSGRLVFFSGDGLPTWDIDFEDARPTGLSLSGDGRCAAVTLRDGTVAVYELEYGERLAAVDTEQVLMEARAARDGGNLHAALEVLRGRLNAVPSDALACEALCETLVDLRERSFAAAVNAEVVGDFATADARLAEIVREDTHDTEAVVRRRDLHMRWAQAAREAGDAALAQGNGAEAERSYLEAAQADPLDVPAREALARARRAAAEGALARGSELLGAGVFTGAIEAFTEAQTRGASGPEVTRLLRQARIGEALSLGNALYQDRQYAAALFQFKKVLRLDPEHPEAQQKVRYAQNFLQDTQLHERFTRLE